MSAIGSFISTVFTWLVLAIILIAIIAFFGYNSLRQLSESIRESWSNIGVTAKKQVSLINQLIDVVRGYQESEKLVMLKVSEDMSSTAMVQQLYQQSGTVLAAVSTMAQRFPELKANEQYCQLIASIQQCEADLESARQRYNANVKAYNVRRSSIPHVFYAATLGFKAAPYLEFEGNEQVMDMGSLQSFSSDEDGDRLNALLTNAGNKALAMSSKALDSGKALASKAVEGGKQFIDAAQEKHNPAGSADEPKKPAGTKALVCHACSEPLLEDSRFCKGCGVAVAQAASPEAV